MAMPFQHLTVAPQFRAHPDLDREPDRLRRAVLVETIRELGPVRDERVLAAMLLVPRHLFVPRVLRSVAYEDRPLHIGWEQTISQPLVVASMT
jgi:protein-L-isoaspartate(D-aspartate) O-methyltransferase